MIPKSCSVRFLLGVLVTLTLTYCLIYNHYLQLASRQLILNEDESQSTKDRRGLSECKCQITSANKENVEPKRVVSYSLFGDVEKSEIRERYYDQLEKRIRDIESRLPGWGIRVYHNVSTDFVCPFECKHSRTIRFYNLSHSLYVNEARINPRLWRFLPLLDEEVLDVMISRDLDSEVTNRDAEAVKEWLNSTYSFHAMRDHPQHGVFILAGMWGGKLSQHPRMVRNMGKIMMLMGRGQDKEADQRFLWLYVWPVTQFDTMVHDSYFCDRWEFTLFDWIPTHPFPTQRNGFDFIGSYKNVKDFENSTHGLTVCPEKCRPVYGKGWKYC